MEVPVEFKRISNRMLVIAVAALAALELAVGGSYWLLAGHSASAAHNSLQSAAVTGCQAATSSASQPNPDSGLAP